MRLGTFSGRYHFFISTIVQFKELLCSHLVHAEGILIIVIWIKVVNIIGLHEVWVLRKVAFALSELDSMLAAPLSDNVKSLSSGQTTRRFTGLHGD